LQGLLEPRLYRAAFIPAVLAAVFAMFSLEDRPAPLPQGLAADALFDEAPALESARRLARTQPDRRAGTPGDLAAAETVERELQASGFETRLDRFSDEGVRLANVVGRRVGASRDQLVVMVARDAVSVPDLRTSAGDTAALLEVARVLGGRASRKTLLLVSVDGSARGDAGARRFLETVEDRDRIEAVIVLSGVGAGRRARPALVQWSNDVSRGSIGLARTLSASLGRELGEAPEESGTLAQVARLALPLGLGAQGVLLERDVEAIRVAGGGDAPADGGEDRIDQVRYAGVGRAVLRAVLALDRGDRPEHGPATYVGVARKVIPGWVLALLAGSLILPALVASVDTFARARRRRKAVGRWAWWLAAGAMPFLVGLGTAELLVLIGQAPNAPPAPLTPSAVTLDGGAAAALGVTLATIALAWAFVRPALLRRVAPGPAAVPPRPLGPQGVTRAVGPSRDDGGTAAGAVLALALALTTLLVWSVNPFAALLLVPALHLWTLAALTDAAVRPRTSALLVIGGLVLPAAVLVFYLDYLSLDPAGGAWYLFLLVTGHHVGLAASLLGCALLGLLGSLIALAVARARALGDQEEEDSGIRGPTTYAGPGSLGGTESALKR
jgi:hypothetical protein